MSGRYNLYKRLKEWLERPVEVKVFDLHNGTTEAKNFQQITIQAEVLEQTPEPRTVFESGHSLALTLQKNWLTSICGAKPEGKLVNVKWLRLKDTKNECVILIEGLKNE